MRRSVAILTPICAVAGCFEDEPSSVGSQPSTSDATTTASDASAGPTGSTGTGGSTTSATATSTTGPVTGSSSTGTTSPDTATTEASGSSTGVQLEPVCPFFDSFDDPQEDPRWIQEYDGSVNVDNGEMVITITPALGDEFARSMLAPEGGMAEATVTMEVGTFPAVVGAQLILWIDGPGTEAIAFTVNYESEAAGVELVVRTVDADGDDDELFSTAHNVTAHRWMRISASDDTLVFSTSADGMSFAVQYLMATDAFSLDQALVGVVGNNFAPLAESTDVSIASFEVDCSAP